MGSTHSIRCPTCGAEPEWNGGVSTGSAARQNWDKARGRCAATTGSTKIRPEGLLRAYRGPHLRDQDRHRGTAGRARRGGFAGATPPRATARSLCSTWHGRTARGDHGKRKATINAAWVGARRYALPLPLRAVADGGAPTKCRSRRYRLRLRSCAWRSAARRSTSPSSRGCPAGKESRVKCTWSGVR